MTRVKERAKIRQTIRSRKKALTSEFGAFMKSTYVDPNATKLLIMGLEELEDLQRQLNAISVKTDEKKIIQRAEKKVDGNSRA